MLQPKHPPSKFILPAKQHPPPVQAQRVHWCFMLKWLTGSGCSRSTNFSRSLRFIWRQERKFFRNTSRRSAETRRSRRSVFPSFLSGSAAPRESLLGQALGQETHLASSRRPSSTLKTRLAPRKDRQFLFVSHPRWARTRKTPYPLPNRG